MFFKVKTYLKFLLSATNQHGVHSPFVYNLVTKCVYNKKRKESHTAIKSIYKNNTIDISYKKAKLLNRLIPYFGYKKVLTIENSSNPIAQILTINNPIRIFHTIENEENFDLIYIDINRCQSNTSLLEILFSKVHNESLFLINSVHESKETLAIWNQLKMHYKTSITIEMYGLGLVFFRKEQAEEHFVIRM